MKRFTTLAIAAALGIILAIGFTRFSNSGIPAPVQHSTLSLASPAPSQTSQPVSGPATLEIPSIDVKADVESVGLDSQDRMDVPKKAMDVGWYDLGVKPGQVGNSVIDGHLDMVTGAPAVFWNLSKLQDGNQIIVTDSSGRKYTYSITDEKSYDWDKFPLQQVFGPRDQANLDLITCQGVWDQASHNYSQRIVVYSRLISE